MHVPVCVCMAMGLCVKEWRGERPRANPEREGQS